SRLELVVRAVAGRPRLCPRDLQPARSPHRRVRRRRDRAPAHVGGRHRAHHPVLRGLMTPAARASAAIEVLADMEARKRPAAEALKDWGTSHRFAGSGDRAAIGNLVFDCLRHRASAAFTMGEGSPRALVLRTLVSQWQMTPEQVATLADGSRHAPQPLSEAELAGLEAKLPATAPAHVRGDFPEWLEPEFDRTFGVHAADQGAGLARRAPVDLRVNTLKADRDKVLKALRRFEPAATPLSPFGIRVAQGPGPSRK